MIIKIKSKNEQLLDVLHKNPQTDFGLYAKKLKNGVLVGQAIDAHHYDIVFQDTKYSYLPEDSNAIDFQSYCNPLVALNIVTDFFTNQLKERSAYMGGQISWLAKTYAEVDQQEVQIVVPSFYIHSSWYRDGVFLLSKYFKGLQVTHKQGKVFELEITAVTAFDAINLLAVTALFTHITNEYGMYTWIDDAFAEKYARVLTNLEAVPYFVFYLFIKRAVRTMKQFELLRPTFEDYLGKQGLDVKLGYYATHQARINYISKELELNISILDIGCGELLYFKRMNKKGFEKNYYAVDNDARMHALCEPLSRRLDTSKLQMYYTLEECKPDEKVNIILTEVIEHNTPANAAALLKQALIYDFNKVIITTPNVRFNQFYSENLASRHTDHHFEWDEATFETFIRACVAENTTMQCHFEQIGDSINGIQPTQAVIITKKA